MILHSLLQTNNYFLLEAHKTKIPHFCKDFILGVASKEFSEKAIPDFCISKRVQVEGRSEGGSLPDPVASPSHCHCQPLPTPLIVKLIYPLLHNFLPFEKILNISNNSFFPMLFCIFKFQIIISFPMFSGFIKIFHCRLSNFPIPEFLCR